MPRQNTEAVKTEIRQLLKRAKKFDDQKQFNVSSKLYKKVLYLDPTTVKNYQTYAQSLSKDNKNIQGYQIINLALLIQPNNMTLYTTQIDLLFAIHQYDLVKQVIKKAMKIDLHNNISLCIKFARASHGAKRFADGVQMIKKYQQKDRNSVMRSQKLLMWRSYLYYQLGNYALAQKYASDILKLSNIAEQDLYYYQIQNFKYLILLGNYKEVQQISNKLILDQKVQLKTKLKTHALKGFYYSRINQPQKALQCLQQALKTSSNDQMTQCKWSLMTIILLTKQNFHLLKSNFVQKRLAFVLGKMTEVTKQKFEDHKFSEHFNWHQQMKDFEMNIQFLLKYFDKIQTFVDQFKSYALNMFLTLIQGFENCIKLNKKLAQIENYIILATQKGQQFIQNKQQKRQNQPQK